MPLSSDTTQERVEGLPVVTCRSHTGATQLVVSEQLGGLVMRLALRGHQWLWRNTWVPLQHRLESGKGGPGRSYLEQGDVGLGDMCLFTVAPDTLHFPNGSVMTLTDHGEVWGLRPPDVSVTRSGDEVLTRWGHHRGSLGFELTRLAVVSEEGVEVRFQLSNRGQVPLPLFWSSHDMVELTPDTRFVLPPGTEMVVHKSKRVELAPGTHRWPRFTMRDGRPLDLSHPSEARAMLGRDFACKVFSREPTGPLKVRQGESELTLSADGTRAGLWINWGGDSPPGERYQLACPERCFGGATDRASEGVQAKETSWLPPGESHAWSLRYS